jgi:nucleotide-binding universal stress UspA family protein
MARILRPSVAETVAYRTRSHSLLLPDQAAGFVDGQSGVASLQRVLCVLDPYQDPRAALAFLRSWLPAFGAIPAEVTVVDTGNGDVFDERQLPQIEGQTWVLRRQLGNIAEVAIELADQVSYDLVVITGQGRLGLRARLAGSNTERILRGTRLPVLIMPGG